MGLFSWISKGIKLEKRKPKTRSEDAVVELQQLSPDFGVSESSTEYTANAQEIGNNAASILFEGAERQASHGGFTQYQFDPNAPFSGGGQSYVANTLGGSTYGNRNILVVTPSSNAEVTEVVTNLRNGDACVVCLEGLDITDAQRRLDFLSGVICAMNGTIKRLNANTYILTPTGIGVRKQQGT